MSKVENALLWMINTANDDSHGYDQIYRWGDDYDCSSAVITAWEQAGVPVKTKGATYTGNMLSVFLKCGFKIVKISDRKRGDVLLAHNNKTGKGHTAMCVDYNNIVHASINEKGTATGGKKGDQTGKEFCIRSYYSKPWDYCLRYDEPESHSKLNENEAKLIISRLYETILKRHPDASGLNAWLNVLRENNSLAHVIKGFFNSSEYLNKKVSDSEFLTDCYYCILNRKPDSNGFEAWLKVLSKGTSRDKVIDDFIDSSEFSNTLSKLYN